jgi:hypothetical protein
VLEAAQVEMIEADRNYVIIRVGKDGFHASSTLQQAELALRSQPMLRISRSCLVNMNYVKEVNRTLRGDFILVLAGGATVTSSEGFRGKVKEYLSTLRLSLITSSSSGANGASALQRKTLQERVVSGSVPDLLRARLAAEPLDLITVIHQLQLVAAVGADVVEQTGDLTCDVGLRITRPSSLLKCLNARPCSSIR